MHSSLNLEVCRTKLRAMSSQAVSNGYKNMEDYLSKILEIGTYQIESGISMLTVPIFFKINIVVFDKIHVEIKFTVHQRELIVSFPIF